MNIKRIIMLAAATLALIVSMTGCKVKYSLSGASIPANANTVSIPYFPNNASMVTPTLSSTMTEALQDKFSRETRLEQVRENGDLRFEGEIVNYTSTPSTLSSDDNNPAPRYRLTITVKVTFENTIDPTFNYNNKTFSAFLDYDSTMSLTEVEPALIPDIVDDLVTQIFNAAVANW